MSADGFEPEEATPPEEIESKLTDITDWLTLEEAWPLIGSIQRLSASSITQYLRCPEQWKQVRLLDRKERPGAALVWGSAHHRALERNYSQKIESHEDMTTPQVRTAFREEFNQKVEEEEEIRIEWGAEKPLEMRARGEELVGIYHEHVSPNLQPIAAEEWFTYFVDDIPIPIVGIIDVETERSIIEQKTTKAAIREPKPDWNLQGRIYQAVKGKPVEFTLAVKSAKNLQCITSRDDRPGLRLEHSSRVLTDRLIRYVANDMAENYRRYGPDEAWPGAITHPWACGYCAFKATCPWWMQED